MTLCIYRGTITFFRKHVFSMESNIGKNMCVSFCQIVFIFMHTMQTILLLLLLFLYKFLFYILICISHRLYLSLSFALLLSLYIFIFVAVSISVVHQYQNIRLFCNFIFFIKYPICQLPHLVFDVN